MLTTSSLKQTAILRMCESEAKATAIVMMHHEGAPCGAQGVPLYGAK